MKNHSIIIPINVYPKPNEKEISAAYILMNYFKTNIKFIPRSNYKTPDFIMNNIKWELKTPTGKGKYNLQHALRDALCQSTNIIIDARYSKLHMI